jgi:hypothetical protein
LFEYTDTQKGNKANAANATKRQLSYANSITTNYLAFTIRQASRTAERQGGK